MPDDEVTIRRQELGHSGEVVALPSLERLGPSLDGHDRGDLGRTLGGVDSLDGAGARQKSLELLQAAVELADRIESQARDAASERLRRADDDVRRLRHEVEEREAELERVRAEVESRHQQALEASRAAQALLDEAKREAAELAERARADAQAQLEQAHAEARANLDQARAEARAHVDAARAEARGEVDQARAAAEELKRSEQQKLEDAVEQAVQQAVEAATRQSNGMPRVEVEAVPSNGNGSAPAAEDALPFVPPPLSPEDLAAVSTLPRLGGSAQRPRN